MSLDLDLLADLGCVLGGGALIWLAPWLFHALTWPVRRLRTRRERQVARARARARVRADACRELAGACAVAAIRFRDAGYRGSAALTECHALVLIGLATAFDADAAGPLTELALTAPTKDVSYLFEDAS